MRTTARGLGQALEGIKAFASLGGGAVVLWIVYTFGGVLLPQAADRAPGGYGGVQMNQWFNTGLDTILPLVFLLLVFFGLVGRAVLARRYA
jgi:hypothetical protein